MLSEIITTEVIASSLLKGFWIVLKPLLPFIGAAVVGAIVIGGMKKLVYGFERIGGSSKREARKKANFFGDLVDIVSIVIGLGKDGE